MYNKENHIRDLKISACIGGGSQRKGGIGGGGGGRRSTEGQIWGGGRQLLGSCIHYTGAVGIEGRLTGGRLTGGGVNWGGGS